MGRPKALLRIAPGSGETFLERLLHRTEGLSSRRAVVSSLPLETELPVIEQPHPERGQLDSLLLGWEALGFDAPWVMSCPVDHPYIARKTLEALVEATQAHPQALMWSPEYRGSGGHPVIFSARLMPRLAEMRREGPREVVRSLGPARQRIETDDETVLWDVDTPQDYERWARRS